MLHFCAWAHGVKHLKHRIYLLGGRFPLVRCLAKGKAGDFLRKTMGKMGGYNMLSMYQHDVNMSFISFFFPKVFHMKRDLLLWEGLKH